MTSTTFRSAVSTVASVESTNEVKPTTTGSTTTVEVPYLDYTSEHGRPHTVDYFSLGDRWQDSDAGFTKEVQTIEGYIRTQIESGDIPNSITAVKNRLKEIEKVTNMSKEERNIIKIGTIAAYVKFLGETQDLKGQFRRFTSYDSSTK